MLNPIKKIVFIITLLYSLSAYTGDVPLEYDLGTVYDTQKAKGILEIHRRIKNIVSLCDCVEVKVLDRKSAEGNITLLEIKFDPKGYKGPVQQEVRLIDENDNLVKLTLKANVLEG